MNVERAGNDFLDFTKEDGRILAADIMLLVTGDLLGRRIKGVNTPFQIGRDDAGPNLFHNPLMQSAQIRK
jgi:hypothetical protein